MLAQLLPCWILIVLCILLVLAPRDSKIWFTNRSYFFFSVFCQWSSSVNTLHTSVLTLPKIIYKRIFRRVSKIAESDCSLRHLSSLYLSVRVEQLGCQRTDFCEIWYLYIFRKYVEKIQISLKCDKNNGYFTWRPVYIYDNISLHSR
jgi:hypothetical protein